MHLDRQQEQDKSRGERGGGRDVRRLRKQRVISVIYINAFLATGETTDATDD